MHSEKAGSDDDSDEFATVATDTKRKTRREYFRPERAQSETEDGFITMWIGTMSVVTQIQRRNDAFCATLDACLRIDSTVEFRPFYANSNAPALTSSYNVPEDDEMFANYFHVSNAASLIE